MKFRVLFLLLLITTLSLFGSDDSSSDEIITEIDKTEIKIGQKIKLITKIKDLKDVKILWQDLSKSSPDFDVITYKDYYEKKYLVLEIDFTSLKPAEYSEFYFTIPIQTDDSEMIYLETKKHHISVFGILTQSELDNVKNIDDPSKIELKKEKEQEKFSFNFKPYIKIILIILAGLLVASIIFYLLYKYLMKRKPKISKKIKIPPFDKFMADLQVIEFEEEEDRLVVERKLSGLTESLKELIYGEYEINAPSETTKELIVALKSNNFDNDITLLINKLFTEIDMIKFAKAGYDIELLKFYYEKIKDAGIKIHQNFKLTNTEQS